MSTIVTRAGKGSALTHNEVDANFVNLNTDKLQSGDTAAALTITSATINGGTFSGSSITDSGLTSGRVTFASTGGLLADSANFFWDNTNARLGIGTTTPNSLVEIAANNTGITTGNALNTLRFYDTDTSSAANQPFGAIEFYGADTSNTTLRAYIRASAESATVPTYLAFGTGTAAAAASERMRLDSSGNLGIGTTPSAWSGSDNIGFDIGTYASFAQFGASGGASVSSNAYYNGTNWIYKNTNGAGRYIINGTDGTSKWYTAPSGTAGTTITFTERMALSASGNLGIGTASPAYNLTIGGGTGSQSQALIGGSAGASTLRLDLSGTGTFTAGFNNSGATVNNLPTGVAGMWMQQAYPVIFGTNATERMRIDSAGQLGVGMTTNYGKVSIANTAASGGLHLSNSTTDTGGYLNSTGTSELMVSGGASYNSYSAPNFVMNAKTTVASGIYFSSGATSFWNNTGLTAGTTFNQTERMRITASGTLGVAAVPSAWASTLGAIQFLRGGIFANAGNDVYLTANMYYNGTSDTYIATDVAASLAIESGNYRFRRAVSGTAGTAITWATGMTLDASGNLLVGTTTATSGGAKLQTVDGITFPATWVVSTNPNTLDDYEEGSFTPTISGSTTAGTGTYGSRTGVYTKIGNILYFYAFVTWTAHTGTGNLLLTALPFTSSASANLAPIVNVVGSTLSFANQLYASVTGNSTQVELRTMVSAAGTSAALMDTSATIIVTGFYYVS